MFFIRHVLPVAILSTAVGFIIALYILEPGELHLEWLKKTTPSIESVVRPMNNTSPSDLPKNIPEHLEEEVVTTEMRHPATRLEQAEDLAIDPVEKKIENTLEVDVSKIIREDAPRPNRKDVDPVLADKTNPTVLESEAEPEKVAAKPEAKPFREFTVRPGDSLSSIANKVYGNKHEYQRIINANRDRLPNPNKLLVGQKLRIPAINK